MNPSFVQKVSGLIGRHRPGQLLAMLLGTIVLGLAEFLFAPAPSIGPGGVVLVSTSGLLLHKAFVMWAGATEGLSVEMIVFHYARPGRFKDREPNIFLSCMNRRAGFMALFAFGMGLAL